MRGAAHLQGTGVNSKIMEIPSSVRQAAGLDDYNRYLVYGEANAFLWPSLDVIPVKSSHTTR